MISLYLTDTLALLKIPIDYPFLSAEDDHDGIEFPDAGLANDTKEEILGPPPPPLAGVSKGANVFITCWMKVVWTVL
ncbi:MAG: hypothetical protein RJR34_09480 [Candidatus Methanoculleus thermohydrogenotrophicum]|nr:hypothetical protein [Candidatus Methanoculleus thermohydrogenotrophicum]